MMYLSHGVTEATYPETIYMELPETALVPLSTEPITPDTLSARKEYTASELATVRLMMEMLGRREDLSHLALEQELPSCGQDAVLETVVARILTIVTD